MSFIIDFYRNKNFEMCYTDADTIFKIIFDKYFRSEIYNEINQMSLNVIKQNKGQLKEKVLNNLTWIGMDKIKKMQLDESSLISEDNIELEDKSLVYLKNNLKFAKSQMISFASTGVLIFGLILSYPIKTIRRSKYSQPAFFFLSFHVILFNVFWVISITDFNKARRGYLETQYKRQIEKYNLILI